MKFSAQEEFGLRCLVAIAGAESSTSLTIPEISRREGLSQPHVAKLLAVLRRGGFVVSTRGQAGGYTLSRAASEICVGDVLHVLGGRLVADDFCERHSGLHSECSHLMHCSLLGLWTRVQRAVDDVVMSVMLADLLADASAHRIRLSDSPRRTQGVVP